MFSLTDDEYNLLKIRLRSQFVTLEDGRGKFPKYSPFAFTEQGVAMLSGVLTSKIAIQANLAILRAFVRIREYLQSVSVISAEINELRAKVDLLQVQQEDNLGAVNDLSEDMRHEIDALYAAIAALSVQPQIHDKRGKIGFKRSDET